MLPPLFFLLPFPHLPVRESGQKQLETEVWNLPPGWKSPLSARQEAAVFCRDSWPRPKESLGPAKIYSEFPWALHLPYEVSGSGALALT